ncbi:hypothetical protein C0993_004773 [Termitomyces sp. T159_Od127]|nr:hypothetical protein C0993_004773 [Termitomyces sp. T159_Od127]
MKVLKTKSKTGKTAFMAWKEYSHAKKVSRNEDYGTEEIDYQRATAGGGELVIQLAKLDGLKVIASAGLNEKVKFMEAIGADVAFNYKKTRPSDVLNKEGPIDVSVIMCVAVVKSIYFGTDTYWDNVGGETLEAALDAASVGARSINLMNIVANSISMHGFIIFKLELEYQEEFDATIPDKVASGEFKYTEEITEGLDKVGDVILAVQKGQNKAKAVIKVADD